MVWRNSDSRRRRLVFALVFLLAAAALPAAATPAAPATPPQWDRVRADAFARLDDVRTQVGSRRLADAVHAAAGLAQAGKLEAPPPLQLSAAVLPPGVPPGLGDALGRVHAAVGSAARVAPTTLRMDRAELEALMERVDAALRRLSALEHDDADAERDVLVRSLMGMAERVELAVDRGRLAGAALALAGAIDDALPRLQPWAQASVATSSLPAAACDVVDQPPHLCVGGSGANAYAKDYALLVDLGGDDVYTNSAGGADPVRNGLAVSVVIDLGGSDRYTAETPPQASGLSPAPSSHVVQGGGWLGGIGMLVDVAGNDRYEAFDGQPEDFYWSAARAQGFATAGVGILGDFAGDDSYRITADAQAKAVRATGLGVAGFGALGLALDWGGGDDTYLIHSRRPSRTPKSRCTGAMRSRAASASQQASQAPSSPTTAAPTTSRSLP